MTSKQLINRCLRKLVFPARDTRYESEPDSVLKHILDSQIPSRDRATAELELDTRAWLRDFWTRSIVAWLALLISAIALAVAICSFQVSIAEERRETKPSVEHPHE
jgi:hypothetical protein